MEKGALISATYYTIYSIFVFYQQSLTRNFRGSSQAFLSVVTIFSAIGMLGQLAYFIYYGWNVSWLESLAICAGSIVIGAIEIGGNVTIFQGVTLGAKNFDMKFSSKSRPHIGNNVTIGAGAKVLGGIKLGDNSTIAANAVVLSSVGKNLLVAGIPAKIIKNI
jgi:acetyltransferase-like isoleucine patch superfamily enzyme